MKSASLLLCLSLVSLAGCSQSPPADKQVFIQLRRGDALGSGAALPVPPRTFGVNGTEVGISGRLVKITDEWIAVDTADTPSVRLWIPKFNVLLIEYRTK